MHKGLERETPLPPPGHDFYLNDPRKQGGGARNCTENGGQAEEVNDQGTALVVMVPSATVLVVPEGISTSFTQTEITRKSGGTLGFHNNEARFHTRCGHCDPRSDPCGRLHNWSHCDHIHYGQNHCARSHYGHTRTKVRHPVQKKDLYS